MSDGREGITNALQSLPATTAIALWIGGKDINFWVGVAGLVFITLQAAFLVWKWSWQHEVRSRRRSRANRPSDDRS